MGRPKSTFRDLTNQEFGRWTVLEYVHEKGKHGKWKCVCRCGTIKLLYSSSLLGDGTNSCGCWRPEKSRIKATTHGEARTPLYGLWAGIKRRCYNKNDRNYLRYGARGIVIEYAPWITDYTSFRDWALVNGYEKGLEIDRRDNSKGYSPDNCQFITKTENLNNTRTNHWILAFGETKTIAQWSRDPRCSISAIQLNQRIHEGMDSERAIVSPMREGAYQRSAQHRACMEYTRFNGMI